MHRVFVIYDDAHLLSLIAELLLTLSSPAAADSGARSAKSALALTDAASSEGESRVPSPVGPYLLVAPVSRIPSGVALPPQSPSRDDHASTNRPALGTRVAPNDRRTAAPIGVTAHAVRRWARVVLQVVHLESDPRTLAEWGRSVGVSAGTIRNWCRTARLSPRRSLQFSRVLRAVVRQHHLDAVPEDLLDITDLRTLTKVLALSGPDRMHLPRTVTDFLREQQFIDHPRAIAEIATALSSNTDRPTAELAPGLSRR